MTQETLTFTHIKARSQVFFCALFMYWAYRILGATKEYAWGRARVITANAILDKTVELTGVADPRKSGKNAEESLFALDEQLSKP